MPTAATYLRNLSDESISAVAEAYRIGTPPAEAAAMIGVTDRALRRWIKSGRDELERLEEDETGEPTSEAYTVNAVRLYQAIKAAQARFTQENLLLVRRAATEAKTRKTVTRQHKNGTTEVEVTETVGGMWQAAAWLLERRNTPEFGRQTKVEVSGPEGGPIEIDASTEERISEKLAAYYQGVEDARSLGALEIVPSEEPADG